MSPHAPDCAADPTDTWNDGTHRYCEICGALLAIWPDTDDLGWCDVA